MNPLQDKNHGALPATFLLVDGQGIIFHAEPGAHEFLGISRDALLHQPLAQVFPGEAVSAALREVCQQGVRKNFMLEREPRPLRASLSPVVGAPWFSLLLAPEDGGANFEAEVVSRIRTTIDQVVSGFAHEVRNPVAAILSLTEAAMLLSSDAKVTAMLARIPALVDRVDKLIKQAVSYSRPRPPQRRAEPVRRLLDWAIDLSRVREKCPKFSVSFGDLLAPVFVDADHIERVIANLLTNAREAARSRVDLRAFSDPEQPGVVVIEVSDDGEGILLADREMIFEPFFTTKPSGTGLGLAIARDLVRLNGGELQLFSTSSSGTVFRLFLEVSETGWAP